MRQKSKNALALAKPSSEISNLKMNLYKNSKVILANNIKSGNWLAAIVIEESIISDRIESVMLKMNVDSHIRTLGENIDNFRAYANRQDYKYQEILSRLESWSRERNYAIHMLVKTHAGENLTWEQRIERIRNAAINGAELTDEINKWAKRKLNRSPA